MSDKISEWVQEEKKKHYTSTEDQLKQWQSKYRFEHQLHEICSKFLDELNQKYAELNELCGEMITTLRIEKNQSALPKELNEISSSWERRYKKTKKEQKTCLSSGTE